MYESLLYEVDAGVATITINRPERRNALSWTVMSELRHAFETADRAIAGRPALAINPADGPWLLLRAACGQAGLGEVDSYAAAQARAFVDQPSEETLARSTDVLYHAGHALPPFHRPAPRRHRRPRS